MQILQCFANGVNTKAVVLLGINYKKSKGDLVLINFG